MTKDEIIEMRKQAGLLLGWPADGKNIIAFAKLVAEKAIKEALAQLEQVKLTDDEIFKIYIAVTGEVYKSHKTFAHAIEAKLKKKNS